VADGGITLYPDDPTLQADAGSIVNGKYKFLASAGKKRVEIRASKEVPYTGPSKSPRDPVFAEYIPANCHEKSELTLDVATDRPNQQGFALDSK